MKKIIALLNIFIIYCACVTQALTVFTIEGKYGSNPDVPKDWVQIEWSHAVLDIIAMVNSYLRFWIWFFCFLFMIWNWYKLISANWDEKATGSATKALIWCAIWIAICLLAYVIVNIAVNLFAK